MVVKTVVEAQDIFDKAWEGFKKQQLNWAPEMKQVVDELV